MRLAHFIKFVDVAYHTAVTKATPPFQGKKIYILFILTGLLLALRGGAYLLSFLLGFIASVCFSDAADLFVAVLFFTLMELPFFKQAAGKRPSLFSTLWNARATMNQCNVKTSAAL